MGASLASSSNELEVMINAYETNLKSAKSYMACYGKFCDMCRCHDDIVKNYPNASQDQRFVGLSQKVTQLAGVWSKAVH